jgi:hypothetical protein
MNNLLIFTVEIKNPNIYTYYKLKSFIKIIDDNFVKFKLSNNYENVKTNEIKQSEINGSDNIINHIDMKMNKIVDEGRMTQIIDEGMLNIRYEHSFNDKQQINHCNKEKIVSNKVNSDTLKNNSFNIINDFNQI